MTARENLMQVRGAVIMGRNTGALMVVAANWTR